MEAMANLDPFSSMIYDDLHIYIYTYMIYMIFYDHLHMIYEWTVLWHLYFPSLEWWDNYEQQFLVEMSALPTIYIYIYIYGDNINAIIQSHL